MMHEDEIPGVKMCKAGMYILVISKFDATGIPKGCPLENFDGSSNHEDEKV